MKPEYITENSGPLWKLEIKSFDEMRDLIDNEIDDIEDYVFRGQSENNWRLSSTLNRLIKHARQTGAKEDSIEIFVKSHMDRFKLEIRGRRGDNPPKLDEDELWALGQHYGLATPLLEWSSSPYIALFFALETLKKDNKPRALWCLNRKRVESKNDSLDSKEQLKLIFPDSNDNKRLLGQSGLFSKGPVMETVDQWVEQKCTNVPRPVLLKVKFPGKKKFRIEALQKLRLMNINHSTIFPDLIGASRHCNIIAEDYEV